MKKHIIQISAILLKVGLAQFNGLVQAFLEKIISVKIGL